MNNTLQLIRLVTISAKILADLCGILGVRRAEYALGEEEGTVKRYLIPFTVGVLLGLGAVPLWAQADVSAQPQQIHAVAAK